MSLRRHVEREGRAGQAVFNFHGPVGAVQTGPGAVANVVQHIGPHDRAEILRALAQLAAAIQALGQWSGPPREQVLELVDECRVEVERAEPNGLRIAAVAMGIAAAVQTVADGRPAYDTLKAALAVVGVSLP